MRAQSVFETAKILLTSTLCKDPIFKKRKSKKKTELRGLSPRANYTDRATAACRRS
jgi:hypothetical protein